MEFGGGVAPDDADQREVPYGASGDALFGGVGGAVVGEGVRGSDWVLPGTYASERAAVVVVGGAAEVAAAGGGASGTARAAAHVTPIEEARNPRMPLILDIVRQMCPSGN